MVNWSKVAAQIGPIVSSFVSRGIIPTVRTVYYALVSKELIPNTRSAYQGSVKKLVSMRKKGDVDWGNIADETRETRGEDEPLWEPDEYAKAYVKAYVKKLRGFTLPRWLNQSYYIEVWIEKFALARTFQNWIGDLNVVLTPSRGYSSWTFLWQAQKRIAEALEGTDKEAIILYFGDFDPSGRDIERFITETLEWFGISVEVKNIAVTEEQIERYKLPSTPEDEKEIAKMMRDPRYKKWEHGLFRVELDALMAFVPEEFKRIVTESVSEYFDDITYGETLEEQGVGRKRAWKLSKELMRRVLEEDREE